MEVSDVVRPVLIFNLAMLPRELRVLDAEVTGAETPDEEGLLGEFSLLLLPVFGVEEVRHR
jgi:hypothetical protein